MINIRSDSFGKKFTEIVLNIFENSLDQKINNIFYLLKLKIVYCITVIDNDKLKKKKDSNLLKMKFLLDKLFAHFPQALLKSFVEDLFEQRSLVTIAEILATHAF